MGARQQAAATASELKARIAGLEHAARQLFDLSDTLDREVRGACAAIIRFEQQRAAANTNLRDVVPNGTRVNTLEGYGIRTIADASGLTAARLGSLRGIGPSTVAGVQAALRSFPDMVARRVRLIPSPSDPRPDDTDLIRALDKLAMYRRQVAPVLPVAREAIAEAHGMAAALLPHTKLLKINLSATSRKALLADGPAAIAELQRTELEVLRLMASAELPPTSQADLWRNYQANNAMYVAMLEAYAPQRPTQHQSAPTLTDNSPHAARQPSATQAPARTTGHAGFPDAPYPGLPDPAGGLPPELAAAIESFRLEPGPMVATLRRYQQFGARFLAYQRRAILGDDMGLGKTVQVLAVMCHLHTQGATRFVVIAPNSVLMNWVREVEKHTALKPRLAYGGNRTAEVMRWQSQGGVLITTYSTASSIEEMIGNVDLLAIDEAHYVRNSTTQRTRTAASLANRSAHLALLTGTAIENRLSEMGNLVSFTNRGMASLVRQLGTGGYPDPHAIRRQLAPVYLRRTQQDVLTELPPLTQMFERIEPTPADSAAYRATPRSLMSLRKSASLGDGTPRAAKFERLTEILETYRDEGKKVVVFSYFREVLDLVARLAGVSQQINGSTNTTYRQSIIDSFSATNGFAVLVCQIDAGGIGTNLQAAQVVILMEPQLKPSSEVQAIARVRRMGQTCSVNVHRLVALGTIEEKLVELVRYKQQIFDDYADPSALKDASAMATDGSSLSLEEELMAVMAVEFR